MELFSPGHLVVLVIITALLFFGWKQLPDMARSAGRSLRVFRAEVKGLADDDAARETRNALTAPLSSDLPSTPPTPPPPVPAAGGSWTWQPAAADPATHVAQGAQPAPSAAVDAAAQDVTGKSTG